MKKYLTKISYILLFMGIYFFANFLINSHIVKTNITTISESTILAGESHVKSGLNPDLIQGSRNIAQPAETLLLTYYKLKKLSSVNPKVIQRIIVSLGHHTLSGYNDTKFSNEQHAYEFTKRAYPLMTMAELKQAKVDWKIYIKTYIKYMLLYPHKNHDTYIGRFNPRKTQQIKSSKMNVDAHIKRHYYDDDDNLYAISKQSIAYLDSIITFCNRENMDLVLINMPVHPNYTAKIPYQIDSTYQKLKQNLLNRKITFYDLQKMEINNNYFINYDHLNTEGADFISKWLDAKLKK